MLSVRQLRMLFWIPSSLIFPEATTIDNSQLQSLKGAQRRDRETQLGTLSYVSVQIS